jgi:hypothetical protein
MWDPRRLVSLRHSGLLQAELYFFFTSVLFCCPVVRVPSYRSRGTGFDSRCYQIFWEVVSLERGPLSLVSTIEELLERHSSGSGLERREYGLGDPLRCPRDTLYTQLFALISPTSCGRSVGIVRSWTKATEFCLFIAYKILTYSHLLGE